MAVLSPAHYWEKAITEFEIFIAALDAIDETDRTGLRKDVIRQYFDRSQNAVSMEY